jgi:hypothetical protein
VISRNRFALFRRLLSILLKLFSSASMVLVTGVVSVEGSLPLWETTCTVTTRIISVFALSLEKFLLLSASSLFCVNGVSMTALLDASLRELVLSGKQVSDIANSVGTDATSIEYDFLCFLRFPA